MQAAGTIYVSYILPGGLPVSRRRRGHVCARPRRRSARTMHVETSFSYIVTEHNQTNGNTLSLHSPGRLHRGGEEGPLCYSLQKLVGRFQPNRCFFFHPFGMHINRRIEHHAVPNVAPRRGQTNLGSYWLSSTSLLPLPTRYHGAPSRALILGTPLPSVVSSTRNVERRNDKLPLRPLVPELQIDLYLDVATHTTGY